MKSRHRIVHGTSLRSSLAWLTQTLLLTCDFLFRRTAYTICMCVPWLQHLTCVTLGILALLAPGLQLTSETRLIHPLLMAKGVKTVSKKPSAKVMKSPLAPSPPRKPEPLGVRQQRPCGHIDAVRWRMFKNVRERIRSGISPETAYRSAVSSWWHTQKGYQSTAPDWIAVMVYEVSILRYETAGHPYENGQALQECSLASEASQESLPSPYSMDT